MKQPFTIGGSVALKKALLEEAGVELYSEKSLNDTYLTPCHYSEHLCGIGVEESTHYQLPQQYNEAVQAVKDFFTEEPTFEKGKWYYTNAIGLIKKCIAKLSHIDTDGVPMFSETIILYKNTATYCGEQKIFQDFQDLQPATPKQIQEMLVKVAEQKGLIGGNKIKPLYANPLVVPTDKAIYRYDIYVDELSLNYQTIYEKGKWAELLYKQEPKPEKLVLKDVIKIIEEERRYQLEFEDKDSSHIVSSLNMGGILTAIQHNLSKAQSEWYSEKAPYPNTTDALRKIAALCVKAGEDYGMTARKKL